jgi:hypothetical protein
LWRYQALKTVNLLAKSKQFRLFLKKSLLKRNFSMWTDKYHSKAAATHLENKKILQYRMTSSSLKSCFTAWVQYRDSALIQHLKQQKGLNHYKGKALKAGFEEWRVNASINRLKRNKRATAYRRNWRRQVNSVFLILKEHYERRKIRRNVVKNATLFAAKSILKRNFRFLKQFLQRKQIKKSQERFAQKMRKNDLIEDCLRRIMAVGFQWRSQRLSLTYQSREHKDRRVWATVAKCAAIWKRKALKHCKTTIPQGAKPAERGNISERVMPRPLPVIEEKQGNSRRPPPRRLNAQLPTDTTKNKPTRAASPALQYSRSNPPIRPASPIRPLPSLSSFNSPETRLMEIEAELLEYKIEKDYLQSLEQASATPSSLLLSLRLQYQHKLPRIKSLFSELSQLRSLAQTANFT